MASATNQDKASVRRDQATGIPALGVAVLSAAGVLGLVATGSAVSGGHAPVAAALAIAAVLLAGSFVTLWGINTDDAGHPAAGRVRLMGILRIWILVPGIVVPVAVMAGWLPPMFALASLALMATAGALR